MKRCLIFLLFISLVLSTCLVCADSGDSLLPKEKKYWHTPKSKPGDPLLKNKELEFRHKKDKDALKLNEPVSPFIEKQDPYRYSPYKASE